MLLVIFGSNNEGESWTLARHLTPFHEKIQKVYPGKVGTLFIGVRHNADQHQSFSSGMPWFVAKFRRQSELRSLTRFAPNEGPGMVVLTRQGVPLLAARGSDDRAIRKFIDDFTDLLWQAESLDPRGWKDREHYFRTVRPLAFAQGSAGPLLIGKPLRVEALRQHGVSRVAAQLEISAEGVVTAATILPESNAPANFTAPS